MEDVKKLYRKAVEEFEIAREKNDRMFLCDACAKGWVSAIEATYVLLLKKGVKEEETENSTRKRRKEENMRLWRNDSYAVKKEKKPRGDLCKVSYIRYRGQEGYRPGKMH